jgi:NADH dehydrogenase
VTVSGIGSSIFSGLQYWARQNGGSTRFQRMARLREAGRGDRQRAMNHIRQVTVFGGSGFIGRAMVQALAPTGVLVRVACRRIELAEPIKTAGDVGQITLMRANVRMPGSVASAIQGSQAVINATGIGFERGRQRYQAVHVEGARTIAEAARAAGVERLVHVSGIGADQRGTKNRYIKSKVDAEDAIVAGFEHATILRPSVVFGSDDVVFNRLARMATLTPVLPLVGDGKARVQPVYVGDVAAAAVAVLQRPQTAKSVFELGGPRVYTWREIAALTLHEIDRRRPVVGVPADLMKIAAFFAELPAIVGLTPQLTRDQVDLLTHDNVVRAGAQTLATLGIAPTGCEAILPTYLDRFRIGGRYNKHAPA